MRHVVLVSASDTGDLRQDALTLADASLQVTLLVPAKDDQRGDALLGTVRLARVPVGFALRELRKAGEELRRARERVWVPSGSEIQRVGRLIRVASDRDTASASRAASRVYEAWLRALEAKRMVGRVVRRTTRFGERIRGAVTVGVAWQVLLPEVSDLDLAMGPVIDALEPDVVHAVGAAALPLAVRAAARARGQGRAVEVIYDERHGHDPGSSQQSPRIRAAWRQLVKDHLDLVTHRITHEGSLSSIYGELSVRQEDISESAERPWRRPSESPFVGVGMATGAGSGWRWMRALQQAHPEVRTQVLGLGDQTYLHPADLRVSRETYEHDLVWHLTVRELSRERWTHALIGSGMPIFGLASGRDPRPDIAYLRSGGVLVGLTFHGTEVRDPVRHAGTHRWSPFSSLEPRRLERLLERTTRNLALAEDFDGPIFVSTPDLLDYIPHATWLPVCVDLNEIPLREKTNPVPLVLHAPTNPWVKGTAFVEEAVRPLAQDGRIDYRSITGVSPQEALDMICSADIVIDQLTLGLYGVLSCEALASGAVVIGEVGERLRARVPDPVPIVEADPGTLRGVLEQTVRDLDTLRGEASQRRAYVEKWHSGSASAQILWNFIGGPHSETASI